MKIKLALATLIPLTLVACSSANNIENASKDSSSVESTSTSVADVPRDTTPVDETEAITSTTNEQGETQEGYGTAQFSDILIKIAGIVKMEANTSAYAANNLKLEESFEGLDRYLSTSPEAWLDGVVSAVNKGILPQDAELLVNGVDFRELTALNIKLDGNIELSLQLREVTCVITGIFVEKTTLAMDFTWEAPVCTTK
jgi:hypothetical protein